MLPLKPFYQILATYVLKQFLSRKLHCIKGSPILHLENKFMHMYMSVTWSLHTYCRATKCLASFPCLSFEQGCSSELNETQPMTGYMEMTVSISKNNNQRGIDVNKGLLKSGASCFMAFSLLLNPVYLG